MALYNNGFPATYQQYYPMPQQQNYQPQYQAVQPQQPPVQMTQQPQQNNNGFIRVQSENEARMYPVAPGNSVTFINENAPYCYTKTVDMSQLDRPKFDKYRLVKEEDNISQPAPQVQDMSIYATKADVESELKKLKELIKNLSAERKEENETTDS